jgi:hypothetical protein
MLNIRVAMTVLLLISSVSLILAQEHLSDYVLESEQIIQFSWSSSGSELQIVEKVEQEIQALTYSPERQQVRLLGDPEDINALDLKSTTNPLIASFSERIFVSPSGQWAVNGVTTDEPKQSLLALHNLETKEFKVLDEAQTIGVFNASLFDLVWSADSSAFYVYTTNGPVTYWYYVSGFTEGLDNVSLVAVDAAQGNFVDKIPGFGGIVAIDESGDYLLIEAFRTIRPERSVKLIMVNMSDLNYIELLTSNSAIKAASFEYEENIYYINDEGMFVYSISGDRSRLLSAEINAIWIYKVKISPDGRYVAVLDSGPPDRMYIIPVRP